MAYSVVPKMRRDGQIVLKDNGATNSITVQFESGDFNFTPTKAAEVVIRDRHAITNVRKGDEEASATGSFTIFMREFTDSAQAGSVMDFVNKTGILYRHRIHGRRNRPRRRRGPQSHIIEMYL